MWISIKDLLELHPLSVDNSVDNLWIKGGQTIFMDIYVLGLGIIIFQLAVLTIILIAKL